MNRCPVIIGILGFLVGCGGAPFTDLYSPYGSDGGLGDVVYVPTPPGRTTPDAGRDALPDAPEDRDARADAELEDAWVPPPAEASVDAEPDVACVPATCCDNHLDGNESDVDCGGVCARKCLSGQKCGGFEDCVSGVCEGGAVPRCQ